MKKDKRTIVGMLVTDRMTQAASVQALLSEYGCNIKTRLGLHDVDSETSKCSKSGLILLEMVGGSDVIDEFIRRLEKIDGIEVKKMVFGEK